jgi:two-component system chemotaxis response regulator CheY
MLVDWNMPEMNGLDLVRAVRADPDRARMVLMMVTTETEIEQMVRALAAAPTSTS